MCAFSLYFLILTFHYSGSCSWICFTGILKRLEVVIVLVPYIFSSLGFIIVEFPALNFFTPILYYSRAYVLYIAVLLILIIEIPVLKASFTLFRLWGTTAQRTNGRGSFFSHTRLKNVPHLFSDPIRFKQDRSQTRDD